MKMGELILTTYDWVPEFPRGYVKDLRVRLADHPACRAYVERATARPAFAKAYADQMAHFAAADSAARVGRK
jgi:glutathione S-transferase